MMRRILKHSDPISLLTSRLHNYQQYLRSDGEFFAIKIMLLCCLGMHLPPQNGEMYCAEEQNSMKEGMPPEAWYFGVYLVNDRQGASIVATRMSPGYSELVSWDVVERVRQSGEWVTKLDKAVKFGKEPNDKQVKAPVLVPRGCRHNIGTLS